MAFLLSLPSVRSLAPHSLLFSEGVCFSCFSSTRITCKFDATLYFPLVASLTGPPHGGVAPRCMLFCEGQCPAGEDRCGRTCWRACGRGTRSAGSDCVHWGSRG